jgi:hypothetical protein
MARSHCDTPLVFLPIRHEWKLNLVHKHEEEALKMSQQHGDSSAFQKIPRLMKEPAVLRPAP